MIRRLLLNVNVINDSGVYCLAYAWRLNPNELLLGWDLLLLFRNYHKSSVDLWYNLISLEAGVVDCLWKLSKCGVNSIGSIWNCGLSVFFSFGINDHWSDRHHHFPFPSFATTTLLIEYNSWFDFLVFLMPKESPLSLFLSSKILFSFRHTNFRSIKYRCLF